MEIVATTSLPAVDRPNADRWNAARSRQFLEAVASLGLVVSLSQGVSQSGTFNEIRK